MWSIWVVDTITGDKRFPLMIGASGMVSAFSWERLLCMGAGGSMTVQISGIPAGLDVLDLLDPIRNTLVLDWDGVVIYAGLIWELDYNGDAGTIAVSHEDLWSILEKRFAVDKSQPDAMTWKVSYTNLSLGTLAKRAVSRGTEFAGVPVAALPISYPPDATAATGVRTYYGYMLEQTADVLSKLMAEGVDIDFEPRWVADKLNWLMRVGQPLVGTGVDWHIGAPESGSTGVGLKINARKVRNNSVAVGEGSEQDMLARSSPLSASIYPMVEGQSSYKSEKNLSALSALAVGDATLYHDPSSEFRFNIMASGTPGVTSLRLAGMQRAFAHANPVLPAAWESRRLIGFSGSLAETVSLKLQPVGVV